MYIGASWEELLTPANMAQTSFDKHRAFIRCIKCLMFSMGSTSNLQMRLERKRLY